MRSFAIIAEGVTDQAVIENILVGYFGDEEEPSVNPFHPPRDPAGQPSAGGWTLLLRVLREKKHVEALQNNDYVVLQVDTDCCEDKGFDVRARAEDGRLLSPVELASRVRPAEQASSALRGAQVDAGGVSLRRLVGGRRAGGLTSPQLNRIR